MKEYRISRDKTGVTVMVADGKWHYQLRPDESQAVHNHSQEFEFGYAGSGPARLALAILLDYIPGPEYAQAHHQAFKNHMLAGMIHPGGTITGDQIDSWLMEGHQQ